MRLKVDQLTDNLQRRGLLPVYCLSGDEPLQILEAGDLIRTHARRNGFEERTVLNVDKGFDWNQLRQAGANMSLFSSKRLIELRLGEQKPGKEGGAALVEYTAAPDPDNVLLVTAGKLDGRSTQTKWYKALDKAGAAIQVWPVGAAGLPSWIQKRTRLQGKRINQEAARLLAERVEGNLLAARQELDKLCLLVDKPEIDQQDVLEAVYDSARFDVFGLVDAALQGQTDRIVRMLRGLRQEGAEPLAVFGALMWKLRLVCSVASEVHNGMPRAKAFAEFHIWQQHKPAINAVLDRSGKDQITEWVRSAATLDRVLKGAIKSNAWESLENFLFRIAGVRLQSLPQE